MNAAGPANIVKAIIPPKQLLVTNEAIAIIN